MLLAASTARPTGTRKGACFVYSPIAVNVRRSASITNTAACAVSLTMKRPKPSTATPNGLTNAFGFRVSPAAPARPSSTSLSDAVLAFRTAPTSSAPEMTLR